jgi:hypothetical protein
MRIRFKAPNEQRAALRAQLARVQQPAPALEILRAVLPADFKPASVVCTLQSAHPDRFVLRAQVRSDAGDERAFALKAYSDDFVERVWTYSHDLVKQQQSNGHPNGHGLCLPMTYVPHERILIFPWVDGRFLSEIVDDPKPELLRQAARIAARLHCSGIVPEPPTTAQSFVEDTLARCERLRNQWPEAAPLIEPLMASLQEASTGLDPADPAPVHGDMAAGQFLWTGERLVLLDLDMFGYTDPAYDVGHFLAQIERRCLWDASVRAHGPHWLACFRDTYLAAMPQVSPRNVTFYRGLTLIRKIYTIVRTQRNEWQQLAPQLAARAQAALQEVVASRQS